MDPNVHNQTIAPLPASEASARNRTLPRSETKQNYHTPRSVAELTQRNTQAIAELEEAAKADRSAADRVADAISGFCGRMAFIYLHVAWFSLWCGWNALPFVPDRLRLDPFPFPFLTFMVSLEAILLSTFILISQNRQGRLSERRNHLDLQINLLSEQENSKVLAMLESLLRHHGIDSGDPEVKVLEESTQPDEMVRQIQSIIENNERESKAPDRNGA